MESIISQVFKFASKYPEKTALSDGTNSITYSKLCEQILFASDVLRNKYKIEKGDKVIISASTQLEFASVYFACHLLKAITLPLAPDINKNRLSFIVRNASPKISVGIDVDNESCLKVEYDEFVGLKNVYIAEIDFPTANDDTSDILYTTGTTSEPKGVILSHKNISAAALNINTFIGNKSDDVELLALPIAHSFGLGRLRCALSNGQTVVILGSIVNMKRFFRFIKEFKVNGFGMVPAGWAIIKKMSGDTISEYADQLHYVEIGSAPMPIENKQFLMRNLPNTRICMHYGLTEASRSTFIEFHSQKDFLHTIGKSSPNMTVEIRDEFGNKVQNGEEGELCVKGDAVTKGYFNLPQVDAVSYWGEFFRTGDWGTIDNEGYITLSGRKKELINVGGKKVSPNEVEDVLKTLDFIDDCVCISAPDQILGEVVKACVVTQHPELIDKDTINERIATQIENYKLPVYYEIIDEVPKTASGKIQRLSLKK